MRGPLRFSAIVLAAGTSSRMGGTNKLLLPIGDEPLIRRTVCSVLQARPQELVVVTGYREDAVRSALAGLRIRVQSNPAFEDGQMSSVAVGARALTVATDAVMVCLGDMALLTAADYRELLEAFAQLTDRSILVPTFEQQRGNPVVIAWRHLPQLIAGERNVGCRNLIRDHPQEVFAYPAAHDRFVVDIDTPEDYPRLLRRIQGVHQSAQGASL